MEEVTLKELLDAREERAAHQWELMNEYKEHSLISITLNIPGPVKDLPKYRVVLEKGFEAVKDAFEEIYYEEVRHLKTGSEAYLII